MEVEMGEKFARLEKRVGEVAGGAPGSPGKGGALDQIGLLLVKKTRATFRTGGRGPVKWKPRGVPNIPGILSDLARGASVKERRFSPRPILVDTGRLRDSISYKITGRGVSIGSNVPYAPTHHFGGTSTFQIDGKVRAGLAKLFRRRPEMKPYGWLFAKQSVTFRIPARPIFFVTPQDSREAAKLAGHTIAKVS